MFSLCLLFTSCTTLESGNIDATVTLLKVFLAALFAQPNKIFNINFELFDYIVGNELVYYQIDDGICATQTHHTVIVALFYDYDLDNVTWARNIAIAMFKPDIDGLYVQPLKDYVELTV